MRLTRINGAEVQALGGPQAAARQVRTLVRYGASVSEEVREIIEAVRNEGDEALGRYTRRFDTAGAELPPVLVPAEELDRALLALPRELVAGLQVAIANVALVADAGVGADVAVELPQGQRVLLREVPVARAAVYVPGGRAAYPSTVVMGVVTARSAGVIEVAVCAPRPRGARWTP